jgi:pyruvate dehydrogenase E2 component (dihydrolipoamide acetyltransferase)
MPKIMNMSKIGVNMTEATIVEWVVKEGDVIKEGDHILDAETDKAIQEIYATDAGILSKILVSKGETVLCQQPIAILTEDGEELTEHFIKKYTGNKSGETVGEAKTGEEKKEESKANDKDTEPHVILNSGRVRISPLAKKIATDMGIDFTAITPSVPGARIIKADVLAYAEGMKTYAAGAISDKTVDTIPYTGIRKVIGEKMLESNASKPAAALTLHADAYMLMEWRGKLKKKGITVSYNDLLVAITAKALKENPIINSKLEGDEIKLLRDINIGVAVDTGKGLLVPVIKNAEQKGVLKIAEDFKDMLERIKSGRATAEDLTGGTFTITNLGMFGIEQFTPLINPPECCILAVGAIVREPVVDEDDNIKAASRMQLTLVFDHRIVDGAPAARFLQRIKDLIEWPAGIME